MIKYHFSHEKSTRTSAVQFGLLSSKQIRDMSVVTVTNPAIYHRGTPQSGAVNDLLMGTIDRRVRCATCNGCVQKCQGHTGSMELGVPMYNIGYVDVTLKVLRSVCYFCSGLLIKEADAASFQKNDGLTGKLLFAAVYNLAKTRKKCPCCGGPQPQYQRSSTAGVIKLDWPAEAIQQIGDASERKEIMQRVFTSIEAASILNHISDGDCKLMGFAVEHAHPRDMVQDVLLVIPPIARPAIMQSTGSRVRGQDDLTCTLQSILKRAIDLQAHMRSTKWDVDTPVSDVMVDKMGKLQGEIFALVNNSARGSYTRVQRSGAPVKSLVCRLKGKEGRIRGNLNGKRVDFSARSVVSPDPCMDIDEVGVPESVALELTIQERVTSSNILTLREMVRNGAKRLDGAHSVIHNDNTVTQLEFCQNKNALLLEPGCYVERYLQNGDTVIFNRQPSLHKFSLMAHRVRIMSGSTFRLNLSCTSAYNADFDGDEMNLHALQSTASIVEARNLMSVPVNIISPQANKPIVAIVQDSLLGSALMTQTDRVLTKKLLMRYMCWAERPHTKSMPHPAILWPERLWTGCQLFSCLLPKTLTMRKGDNKIKWPKDSDVYIKNGEIMYGRMTKAVLGATAGGIVDVITRDIGPWPAVDFMSDLQRVVNPFLSQIGFSVKISDCILGKVGDAEVEQCVKVAKQNAIAIVDSNLPATMRPASEATVQNIMSKLLMQTGAIAKKHMRADNSICTMVDVGSKGNCVNLSQISGTVAQQTVEGKRLFSASGNRTLSCYAPSETSLGSNGFVESNYCRGLTPEEFFFHSMGGREGLVDTAVKTASSGYIQRRQVKMMEDHIITYGHFVSVRTAQNTIVEFVYGNDGFDASEIERFSLRALAMNSSQLERELCDVPATLTQGAELGMLMTYLDTAREGRIGPMNPALDSMVLTPFHPERLLARYEVHGRKVDVDELEDAVLEHMDRLTRLFMSRAHRNCLVCLLRFCFCSKKLAEHGIDAAGCGDMFAHIESRFHEAIASPGEMVGTLAATSIGEPCTQMTLNTFHYSGVGARGVTQGIPRLKELLDVTKKLRTPSNCLRLKSPYRSSADFAAKLANTLGRTRLSDLVTCTTLLYEPDPCYTDVAEDKIMVAIEEFVHVPPSTYSQWVVRLTLSKNEMTSRGLTPPQLLCELVTRLSDKAHIISSQTNALEWVIRMRFCDVRAMIKHGFPGEPPKSTLEETLVQRVAAMLLDSIQVSGHSAIESAREREIEAWGENTEKNEVVQVIDTIGTSLLELGLIPCVDWQNSTTNDIFECLETLGLEAATSVLLHEISSVISYDGTYVDRRHMQQVVGAMTWQGWVKAISRHGMNRPSAKTGPLVRCSFEETSDVLLDAALWGEADDSRGVTSSVINGDPARIGTHAFDVLMPEWALPSRICASKRQSTLSKSRVRSNVASNDTKSSMELVDTSLWSFNTTTDPGAIDMPFCTPRDDRCLNEHSSVFYASMSQPRQDCIFTPTSPAVK